MDNPYDYPPFPIDLIRRLGPPPGAAIFAALSGRRRIGDDFNYSDEEDDDPRPRSPYAPAPRGAVGSRMTAAERAADPLGTAQERRRVEDERADMEMDNRRIWEDLDRMRRWKDRLQKENRSLRDETTRLKGEVRELRASSISSKAEIKKLKERYENVWKDKVALAEQISGPATLPLEILLSIAGFIAGENNYGTLLNFSLMSKLIKLETAPVLFETMTFNEIRDLAYEPGSRKLLDGYKFTKFVYSRQYTTTSTVLTYFPNAQVLFTLMPGTQRERERAMSDKTDKEDYTPFNAQVTILHPVPSNTLASLLQYPVKWDQNNRSSTSTYHPIQGISVITLQAQGALLPSQPPLEMRNLVRTLSLRASDVVADDRLRESVKEVGRLTPVIPKDCRSRGVDYNHYGPYPAVSISVRSPLDLDVWLESLSTIVARQPHLFFDIYIEGHIERDEFQQRVLTAAAAYGSIWHDIKDEIKIMDRGERLSFFRIEYALPDGDDDRDDDNSEDGAPVFELTGELKYDRHTEGFSTKIVQLNEDTGEKRTIYDQPFVVSAGRS